jgi:hypothetical protein
MTTVEVDAKDLRLAGGLMLGLAVAQPAWAWTGGVPCPLRSLTGIPCPLCGMTTSVCATVTGHLRDAVAANPFGIVAVIVAIWLLVAWRRGRVLRLPSWLPWAGLAVSWAWQLARFA